MNETKHESKMWVIPEAGAYRLYCSLGAAREHVATFKREADAQQAVEQINGWQQITAQRDALLAALGHAITEGLQPVCDRLRSDYPDTYCDSHAWLALCEAKEAIALCEKEDK